MDSVSTPSDLSSLLSRLQALLYLASLRALSLHYVEEVVGCLERLAAGLAGDADFIERAARLCRDIREALPGMLGRATPMRDMLIDLHTLQRMLEKRDAAAALSDGRLDTTTMTALAADSPPAQEHAGLRIFVVDDHDDTRKYLSLYLMQLGYRVLSAGSVAEAMAALPGAKCQVLISDLMLPDGSGWHLLDRVQRQAPLFAVAMTISCCPSSRAASKAVGFRHHLVKPLDLGMLDEILQEAARELGA